MDTNTLLATLESIKQLQTANDVAPDGYLVEFRQPTSFYIGRRRYKDVTRLKFRSFWYERGTIWIKNRRRGRYGYPFPSIPLVEKIMPLSDTDRFDTYEAFARRFDPAFNDETFIRSLWDGGSSQHGGPFRPSDFKTIGKAGKRLLSRFLRCYEQDGKLVVTGGPGAWLSMEHSAESAAGRDIKIEHHPGTTGPRRTFWTSEFAGCANGQYYVLANRHRILHLEND